MTRNLFALTILIAFFGTPLSAQTSPLLPNVIGDTTICPGEAIRLAEAPAGPDDRIYRWTPADELDNDTIPNPVATPSQTTPYKLVVFSADSSQVDSVEFTVTVIPAFLTIRVNDEELCIGDTLRLSASTVAFSDDVFWSSLNGTIPDTTGLLSFDPFAPSRSDTYFVRAIDQGCELFDTLTVFVDSLPANSAITPEPVKEVYCQGDTIILSSPTYEPADFPALQPRWSPPVGFESADSLWNMVITAQVTQTYRRTIVNRGCTTFDTIRIPVDTPLTLNLTDTLVCPGDPVQLEIVEGYDGEGTLEWTPAEGLSCTDCPDPVASPLTTTLYQVQLTDVPCPSNAQVTINVVVPPIDLVNDQEICQGDTIVLNRLSDPTGTYSWTSNPLDPSFDPTDPEPAVSPVTNTTYTLDLTYLGCDFTDQVSISVLQPPTLSLSPFPDTVINLGADVTIEATSGLSGVAETFSWRIDPPGTLLVGAQQTLENINQNTRAILDYSNACFSDTASIEIRIIQVLVPGAFTPNGDSNNDFFNVVTSGAPDILEFRVWNRWGQLVYDNDSPDQGWDGQFNGSPSPADVYVYRIIVATPDGRREEFKGDVTLIR